MLQLSGPLLVGSGAFIISFSPVFVRLATVEPTMAAFYRCLLGALVLTSFALVKGEPLRWERRKAALALMAAVFFGLDLTFWHLSIEAVGPGIATILANLQVFFLAGLAMLFLKERPGAGLFIAMAIAVGGVTLLVGINRFQSDLYFRAGVFFGLLTALAYAVYIIVLRRLQVNERTYAQVMNIALVSMICALLLGLAAWLQGERFVLPDSKSWIAMIAYGVLCQGLGWFLISTGLPKMEASRAGLLLLLQPTGAFIWDILIFARPTSGMEYFGAGLALTAIYLGGTTKKTVPKTASKKKPLPFTQARRKAQDKMSS
jgi:drug/metabolite transporter (DMT)-like permease